MGDFLLSHAVHRHSIQFAAHPHAGDKWCIYPSYDYAHCIVDSLENVTHSVSIYINLYINHVLLCGLKGSEQYFFNGMFPFSSTTIILGPIY